MTRQPDPKPKRGLRRLALMWDVGRVELRAAPASPEAVQTLAGIVLDPGQWWALSPAPGPLLRWVGLAGRKWEAARRGRLVALGRQGETLVLDLAVARASRIPLRLPEGYLGLYLWLPPQSPPLPRLFLWRWGTGWAMAHLTLVRLPEILRHPEVTLARLSRLRRTSMGQGLLAAKERVLEGLLRQERYADWVARHDTPTPADLGLMAHRVAAMIEPPLISVVMPVYNPPADCLRQALHSLRAQVYPHWELCAANDASETPHVAAILDQAAREDPRVRVAHREQRGHISAASNTALAMARGSHVALMDHDDLLPPHALYLVAEEILAHPEVDIIYSDEDKIEDSGRRFGPYFKPDFDPELFLGQNMVSHLGVYRRSLLQEIGGFRKGLEGSQDYDLCLRALEHSGEHRVRHIPRMLYHWRAIATSTANSGQAKTYAFVRARQAIAEALERRGVAAQVDMGTYWGQYVVRYAPPYPRPTISLLAPLTAEASLAGLLTGLALLPEGWSLEIIAAGPARLLEQARRCVLLQPRVSTRLVEASGGWAALVNAAAAQAGGEVLGLVDPGLCPNGQAWLEEAAALLAQPGNGAVGGLLVGANGRVLHAGLVLMPRRVAASVNQGQTEDRLCEFTRQTTRQRLSAVSGACLFTRRETFQRMGGLDAAGLPSAFADVDYCLRLRREGLAVVWSPHLRVVLPCPAPGGPLTALPSLPSQELGPEAALMQGRWGELLAADPYHNPNLTYGTLEQRPVAPRAPTPWEGAA